MIRSTVIRIADNSGVLRARLLGPGRSYRNNVAYLGDKVKASVRKTKNSSLLKGNIVTAIIVQRKTPIARRGGSYISFKDNFGVCWNIQKDSPLSSRVTCPVPQELRKVNGGSKVLAIATIVV
jgi:ribosomal protein L14